MAKNHYGDVTNRILAQLESYARLAGKFLSESKPAAARDQLRHIFGRTTGSMQADQFHSRVFVLLKRCYREMNRLEMAGRCATEARRCAMREGFGVKVRPNAIKSTSNSLLISVIVPTYNRLPILKKCLAALEAQTLPANQFEVIVIDDGSSDGTEAFMCQYTAPFHLQYLRQKNGGTGRQRDQCEFPVLPNHHVNHRSERQNRRERGQDAVHGDALDGSGIVLNAIAGIRRALGVMVRKGEALHLAK